jgi:hypothetical protein
MEAHTMRRDATPAPMTTLAFMWCALVLVAPGAPATAAPAPAPFAPAGPAAQCGQLPNAVERSQCELRESSRERARREATGLGAVVVERGKDEAGDQLSQRWDDAVRDSRVPDFSAVLFSREGALVIGLLWLIAALMRERRIRRRRVRPRA